MKKIYKTVYIFILIFVVSTNLKSQCTYTSTVPYYEGFNTITTTTPMPQCWSSLGTVSTTPSASNKIGILFNIPNGIKYFFSNAVQLYAGVTYSTSVWFTTSGTINWSNLSILYGSAQSSTGLTSLASTPGIAVSSGWSPLSGTFQVTADAGYYFAIMGTSTGTAAANLSIDDFAIEMPCSINPVNLGVSPLSGSVCLGDSLYIAATGADTYSWSNGATSSSVFVSPNNTTSYYVTGTNTLTGCNSVNNFTSSVIVVVKPVPYVSIISNTSTVCSGNPLVLSAIGANSYSWSNGAYGSTVSIAPTIVSPFAVNGSNSFGCIGKASVTINVLPLPHITIKATSTFVCLDAALTLTASGANTYTWYSSAPTSMGPIVNPVLLNSTTFTVSGTDANGCTGSFNISVVVNACSGFKTITSSTTISLYPNPFQNEINIEGLQSNAVLEIFDLNSRLIYSSKHIEVNTTIDLSNLSKGIYFLKIKSDNEVVTKKILKE